MVRLCVAGVVWPLTFGDQDEAAEFAQEVAGLRPDDAWEVGPFAGSCGPLVPIPVGSVCGADCRSAIVAVRDVLSVLDGHPDVRGPIWAGLGVHLAILANG